MPERPSAELTNGDLALLMAHALRPTLEDLLAALDPAAASSPSAPAALQRHDDLNAVCARHLADKQHALQALLRFTRLGRMEDVEAHLAHLDRAAQDVRQSTASLLAQARHDQAISRWPGATPGEKALGAARARLIDQWARALAEAACMYVELFQGGAERQLEFSLSVPVDLDELMQPEVMAPIDASGCAQRLRRALIVLDSVRPWVVTARSQVVHAAWQMRDARNALESAESIARRQQAAARRRSGGSAFWSVLGIAALFSLFSGDRDKEG